ncbi:LOW QUALITY PROTEIN: probable glutamate receptor [Panulirus ornatus]|uniref:LOW QUALITY PROTEIN: probable glutamate receptor n=1 Tax=Panulirus ornatus TaxID=150431 RepID=UPI003A84D969
MILESDILTTYGLDKETNHFDDLDELGHLRALWGVGVFEVTLTKQDANLTQARISRLVGVAHALRQLSWCVTVVVVSDDPAFLTTFTQRSRTIGLLVWSTRLLVVTHLSMLEMQDLHVTFSMTNTLLIITEDTALSWRCGVYVQLPYGPRGSQALRVASWTSQQGLILNTRLPLFPEKFSRFIHQTSLVVSAEEFPTQKALVVDDPDAPGGKRLTFMGPASNVLDYIASGVNFSYSYVRPDDRSWGARLEDGSWSGMVGMVVRQEADFALGPFGTSTSRAEVIDFTWPLWIDDWRILAGRGRLEVDPWGFLLPLTPLVWAAILTTLLVLPLVILCLSSLFNASVQYQDMWLDEISTFIRILLQQDFLVTTDWLWERLVFGVWMMTTVVVTRSYASNLMALLAVRHISQPYQSLRDVLNHPSAVMIWQKNSVNVQYIRSVESGLFREVADLEETGRLIYRDYSQFRHTVDTLVRSGDHILVDVDVNIKNLMAYDFSGTGRCDFYLSRDRYLAFPLALVVPKHSPLGPVLSKRIMALTEAGLFEEWLKSSVPNSTVCLHSPEKITITTNLSLTNIWGTFVILEAGQAGAVAVFFLEVLICRIVMTKSSCYGDHH